jgi:uncharacterized protein YpmB
MYVLSKEVKVNDRPFYVTQDLYAVLQGLRLKYEHRTIWIDAIVQ